jgi:hypothetical protein
MSKFDELLDDVILKAKEVADIAGKKTNEAIEFGKLKYKAKSTAWDIEKAHAKLGAIVYESKKSGEDFGDAVKLAIDELDVLNAKLDDLEERIAAMKVDPVKESRQERPKEEPKDEPEAAPEETFDYTEEE